MKVQMSFAIVLIMGLTACQPASKNVAVQHLFETGLSTGVIEGKKIKEASGLVESIGNAGMFWTHNDSGNAAELFLIDKTGTIKATLHFPTLKNRDWEEVAVSTQAGKNYIYIGEIGDNNAQYQQKYLYRIEEPLLAETGSDTTITAIETITFTLSDGTRDTEAFFIDPLTNVCYIFSKREHRIKLYKLDLTTLHSTEVVAKRVLDALPFTLIVAADISVDGTEILIKNYDNIYYWKRTPQESVEDALKRSPLTLPYTPEPQGEAIAFDRTGSGFYTLSEQKKKAPQHLYFYKRK
jgi:hypothetical protein